MAGVPSPDKVLLVFVPGFYGTEASFASFPSDVIHAWNGFAGGSRSAAVEYKMHPPHDSKGSNAVAVQNLADWLAANASDETYKFVVVLAHSMGGLIAVDALRNLRLTRHRVNVVSLIAFDSPYFGLKSATVLADAPAAISALANEVLPPETRAAAIERVSEVSRTAYSITSYSAYSLMSSATSMHSTAVQTWQRSMAAIPESAVQSAIDTAHMASSIASATSSQLYSATRASASSAYESAARVIPLNEAGTAAVSAYNTTAATTSAIVVSTSNAASSAYSAGTKAVEVGSKVVEMGAKVGSKVVEVGGTAAIVGGAAVVGGGAVVGGAAVAAAVGSVGVLTALGVATVAASGAAVTGIASSIVVAGKFLAPKKTLSVVDPVDESSEVTIVENVELAREQGLVQEDPVEQDPILAKLNEIQARKVIMERQREERRRAIEVRLQELDAAADTAPASAIELPANHNEFAEASAHFDQVLKKYAAAVSTQADTTGPLPVTTQDEPQRDYHGDGRIPVQETKPSSPLDTTTASQESSASSTFQSYLPSRSTMLAVALTGGAYAAYYYSGGWVGVAMPSLQGAAAGWIAGQASEAAKHLKFLYPLWGESRASYEARMEFVVRQMEETGLTFQCFYIELPAGAVETGKDAKVSESRTFIQPPPLDSVATANRLFTKVPMLEDDVKDVASAHMSMLIRRRNIGTYWFLVDEVALILNSRLLSLERNGLCD